MLVSLSHFSHLSPKQRLSWVYQQNRGWFIHSNAVTVVCLCPRLIQHEEVSVFVSLKTCRAVKLVFKVTRMLSGKRFSLCSRLLTWAIWSFNPIYEGYFCLLHKKTNEATLNPNFWRFWETGVFWPLCLLTVARWWSHHWSNLAAIPNWVIIQLRQLPRGCHPGFWVSMTRWCCHALAQVSRDLCLYSKSCVVFVEEIITSTVEKIEKNEGLLEYQGVLVSQWLSLTNAKYAPLWLTFCQLNPLAYKIPWWLRIWPHSLNYTAKCVIFIIWLRRNRLDYRFKERKVED